MINDVPATQEEIAQMLDRAKEWDCKESRVLLTLSDQLAEANKRIEGAKDELGGFCKSPFDGSLITGIKALSMRCASAEARIAEAQIDDIETARAAVADREETIAFLRGQMAAMRNRIAELDARPVAVLPELTMAEFMAIPRERAVGYEMARARLQSVTPDRVLQTGEVQVDRLALAELEKLISDYREAGYPLPIDEVFDSVLALRAQRKDGAA